jgi:hypothetical protein
MREMAESHYPASKSLNRETCILRQQSPQSRRTTRISFFQIDDFVGTDSNPMLPGAGVISQKNMTSKGGLTSLLRWPSLPKSGMLPFLESLDRLADSKTAFASSADPIR